MNNHNPDNAACPCNNSTTIGGWKQAVCRPHGCDFCTCPASPPADEVEQSIAERLRQKGPDFGRVCEHGSLARSCVNCENEELLRTIDRQAVDLAAANERIKWLETWKYDAWVVETDQLKADLAAAQTEIERLREALND